VIKHINFKILFWFLQN